MFTKWLEGQAYRGDRPVGGRCLDGFRVLVEPKVPVALGEPVEELFWLSEG